MHQQFNIQQLYALPTFVCMCFVFIWEQTATCATYIINWVVFITEVKSVYCAVRTGSLNKAVCFVFRGLKELFFELWNAIEVIKMLIAEKEYIRRHLSEY